MAERASVHKAAARPKQPSRVPAKHSSSKFHLYCTYRSGPSPSSQSVASMRTPLCWLKEECPLARSSAAMASAWLQSEGQGSTAGFCTG